MPFIRIAITHPGVREGVDELLEADRICNLLYSGEADYVHIRKPESSESAERLVRLVPETLRPKLTVHDHHYIASQYGLGGIHLNGRHPFPPEMWHGRISRSLHSVAELFQLTASDEYNGAVNSITCKPDYVFLSPVFDSISKPGYRSAFDEDELTVVLQKVNTPVIALGGVTPDRFAYLRKLGFSGGAMLGYFFH